MNTAGTEESQIDIDAIQARWAAATPGPWVDLTEVYRQRMEDVRKKTGRWYHGPTRRANIPIVLIAQSVRRGDRILPSCIPYRVDWFDMPKVLALRWSDVRGSFLMSGQFLSAADAMAIAAAPADVAALVAEVTRLRALLKAANSEEQYGVQ